MSRFRNHWRTLLPYAALLAVWALFFWRFAAPNPADRLTYPAGDFTAQFGVFRDIAYRSLVAGRLPLWADCLDAGYPFQADPQAQLFYPVVWLIFGALRVMGWGNFPIEALIAEAALHYLATSVFLFLFLSSLSLRKSAALLGALTFTYGGYLTGYPPLQTAVLETSTWLPLALWAASRFAASRRPRHFAFTAAALAIAFLAGHPQTFVYVALLTFAYFTFRARQAGWTWRRLAAGAAALVAVTAALAAVQLVPTLQFIVNSTRTTLSFTAASGGFNFGDALGFLLTGYMTYWNPLFVGILPLGLALLAAARPQSEVRFWTVTAVICLVLTFGAKGVAFDAAYWAVPGIRLFHGPERLALGVSFALAILAAFGAHHLLGPLPRSGRPPVARLIRAAGAMLALSLALILVSTYAADLNPAAPGSELPARFGLLAYGLGLALLALLVRMRVPAWRRWTPALFVAAAALDLFAVNRPTNVVPAFDPYPPSPVVVPLQQETGFFRVQDDNQLAGHASCAYGYRSVGSITPYHIAGYAQLAGRLPEEIRWQLLGVRYLITWRQQFNDPQLQPVEVASAPARPRARNEAGITKVFRLAGNEPQRAFVAHRVELSQGDAVYDRLSSPGFDPHAVVLLGAMVPVAPGADSDTVTVARDVPGRVELHTESQGDGVLVLSEAYFPGWQALLDGRPGPVLLADGALLATPLPGGAHTVEFVYRPAALLWGSVLSALGGLLVLGLIFFNSNRRP